MDGVNKTTGAISYFIISRIQLFKKELGVKGNHIFNLMTSPNGY